MSTAKWHTRELKDENCTADLVVVGGGLAGVCCAITAAREGLQVLLVQDRPVLGGNASSEVRLWILGATSHMGNNNRWSREGGVVDEILVENLWRNPEGNPVILDAILLEKVVVEKNIRLLLNTAVDSVSVDESRMEINSACAFCSQNQTAYTLRAPFFCDASGDGILGFLSGASFHMGAEGFAEFGEKLAPPQPTNDLLGHSLYFYSRDTGRPVKYVAPSFAMADIGSFPRFRQLGTSDSGCKLWWLEYGGHLDTVAQTEEIKWELWKIAYGVWNHIKNSGKYPEAENLTLEWMGMIPGKRESRRFIGDYMLTQQDIVEQRLHADAVSFGGWAMDLHPPRGVYSFEPACTQWHSRGVYQIPFRCMYSREIRNLFLTGRLISASHIAFGSTRVMATCAHNGQAVGVAAALCVGNQCTPRDLASGELLERLQQRLLRTGQYIPGISSHAQDNLARSAKVTASSERRLDRFMPNGETIPLDEPNAMLLPLNAGEVPVFYLICDVEEGTILTARLMQSSKPGNYIPEVLLDECSVDVAKGNHQEVALQFGARLDRADYVFLMLQATPGISIHISSERITGVLRLVHGMNASVAKSAVQSPPDDSGIDSFPFWLPERRPKGKNLAIRIDPPVAAYRAEQVTNGVNRPCLTTNVWVAAQGDEFPTLRLDWSEPQTIRELHLAFDTDFDHPLESVLMTHPERVAPFCVKHVRVLDDAQRCVAEMSDNHQSKCKLNFQPPLSTSSLNIEVIETHGAPAAIFGVACYG